MKQILFLLPLLLLSACTEIIDVSTTSADPQLVVEASVVLGEEATVILTKSVGLADPNNFEKVRSAVVRITDNAGQTELLSESADGVYKSRTLKGEVGKTYTLKIESNNKTITSQCKIPTYVPIDSFTVVNSMYPGGPLPVGNQKAPFYEVKLKYTDPVDQENFYRVVLYYNNKPQNRNNIFDDRFNNGLETENTLIIYNDTAKMGDKIRVEMQSIDKEVYNYFSSMGSAGGPPGASSSPANPYTNLTGAILGYFSAHTVERKEWVLKK